MRLESLSPEVGGREEVPVLHLVSVSRARPAGPEGGVGCMQEEQRSSGACQKHQVGSFPSGFKVAGTAALDQDRISYLKFMWHHGRSWFICFFFSNSQVSFLTSSRAFK